MSDREILKEIKEKYQGSFTTPVVQEMFNEFVYHGIRYLDRQRAPEATFEDIQKGIRRNGGDNQGAYIVDTIQAIKAYRERSAIDGELVDLIYAKNKIDQFIARNKTRISELIASYNSFIQ